ncbi:hypothetical protein SI859A1_01802 [Aurantimonas manganoxydans SI85-9A1]|uniref:Uncharacterized protein n=1 Tax=Aurantimonas manganoxydans (strain ATCC BAA-1229 / DSM 21871 / SI85-9A1) TaxID=287752 RepID=Q1YNN5_AURMS|nr:hypothetical protein SI859A1_01802 [Aurantimonas manganoxydans SI85-9A1]
MPAPFRRQTESLLPAPPCRRVGYRNAQRIELDHGQARHARSEAIGEEGRLQVHIAIADLRVVGRLPLDHLLLDQAGDPRFGSGVQRLPQEIERQEHRMRAGRHRRIGEQFLAEAQRALERGYLRRRVTVPRLPAGWARSASRRWVRVASSSVAAPAPMVMSAFAVISGTTELGNCAISEM